MFYKIAELSIKSKKSTARNSDVFIAQPSSEKEKLAGKLFIVIEIESTSQEIEKIIPFLINEINNCYYNNEKILFREKIQTIKVEHIFEASLTKVNKQFANFIVKEKINLKPEKINISAGIIFNNDIHFANTGKNKILLIHKVKNETIQKSKENINDTVYKISDISKQASNETPGTKEKLFSNVISGKIPKKGSFIIANEALVEYISNKQLINIASTLPPASALEQIKQVLAKTNFLVPFNAILIKNTTQSKEEKQNPIARHTAQESISNLNKTEDKTENLLSPSGIINLKKWVKKPKILQKISRNTKFPDLGLKDKILSKKRLSVLQKLKISISKIFGYLLKLFPAIIFALSNNKQGKKTEYFSRLKKLSLKRKILLTVFSVFILLFIYNISSKKIEEKKVQKEINYTELKEEIESKQNKAEANLLYSNEEGAKDLFNEIETLINNYPQETEEQIKEFEDYKEILKLNIEKIQKVTRLDNLEEIVNLKNLNPNSNPENIIFLEAEGMLYASDSEQRAVYSIDPNAKSVTLASDIKTQFNKLSSPAKNSDNDIYFFDNSNILEYSINEEASLLNIELNGNYSGINAIDVYNNRLYILNTTENNIHRHNRITNGFGPAYSWANKNIDLSNAVDISIDGNIYVLKSSGEILRLLRGEKTDWKIEKIEPPLSNPNKIIASIEKNYIYLMEKESNRIVVFDKDGQFIAQYTSDSLDNIIDFSIDEPNQIIYILNNSSIFAIKTTHSEQEIGQ